MIDDYVIMAVTNDTFELPIAVTNTVSEMGKLFGLHPDTISSSMTYKKKRKGKEQRKKKNYFFVKVIL